MNELIDNKEICNPILSLKTFKIIVIYNYNIKYLIDKFNNKKMKLI